jgi:hypothetical protein
MPRDQWLVIIPEMHAGYISFAQYESNLQRLRDNAQAQGEERRKSPPREGPALLQGLAICGRCGRRMTVRYHCRHDRLVPLYVCQREGVEQAIRICQSIPGEVVDQTIGKLLLETVTPMALEVSLSVERELRLRAEEVDRLRQQKLAALRYEAELAQRRFLRVDPDHRLVADELEADWNQCLLQLRQAQQEHELQQAADQKERDVEQRKRILALAQDFPRLWNDPQTPQRERKRMVRLLLEDVTLLKDKELTLQVRFKGGVTRTLTQPKALSAPELRQTPSQLVQEIDRLLQEHSDGQVALELNRRGLISGTGQAFTRLIVAKIRRAYKLKTRYQRLRETGLFTLQEIARQLAVATGTVKTWRDAGLLKAYTYNDKRECLYEPPGSNPPSKQQGRKLRLRSRVAAVSCESNQ